MQQIFRAFILAIAGILAMPTPATCGSNLPYDYNPRMPGLSFGMDVALISGAIILGGISGAVVSSYRRGRRGKTGYDGTDGLNGINGTNGSAGTTGATGTGITGGTGPGFNSTVNTAMQVNITPAGASGYTITASLYGPDGTLLAGPVTPPTPLVAVPNYEGAYELVFFITATVAGDFDDLISLIQVSLTPLQTFFVDVPHASVVVGSNEIAIPIEISP